MFDNIQPPPLDGSEFPFQSAVTQAALQQGVSSEPLEPIAHLFDYNNGNGYLYGDYSRIHRRMMIHTNGNWAQLHSTVKDKNAPAVDRGAAEEELLSAIALAFGLVVLDSASGEGLTEKEIWKIYNRFCSDITKKKVNTEPSPTSQLLSDSKGASPSSKDYMEVQEPTLDRRKT